MSQPIETFVPGARRDGRAGQQEKRNRSRNELPMPILVISAGSGISSTKVAKHELRPRDQLTDKTSRA